MLTSLGIIIGIAAVIIAMVTLGGGVQWQEQGACRELGTNMLAVRPGQTFMGAVDRGDARLTSSEAGALVNRDRGEAIAMRQRGGSDHSFGLVLPGPGTWSETIQLGPDPLPNRILPRPSVVGWTSPGSAGPASRSSTLRREATR